MFDASETPSVNFENLQKSSTQLIAILYTVATLSLYQVLEISSPVLNNFSLTQAIYSFNGLSLTIAGTLSIVTVLAVYTKMETQFQKLDSRQNYIANFLVISTFLTALIPALRQAVGQTTILALTVAAAQIGIFYYLNQGGDH
jgi:hypothetical protein